jgi:hypothetical protein
LLISSASVCVRRFYDQIGRDAIERRRNRITAREVPGTPGRQLPYRRAANKTPVTVSHVYVCRHLESPSIWDTTGQFIIL